MSASHVGLRSAHLVERAVEIKRPVMVPSLCGIQRWFEMGTSQEHHLTGGT